LRQGVFAVLDGTAKRRRLRAMAVQIWIRSELSLFLINVFTFRFGSNAFKNSPIGIHSRKMTEEHRYELCRASEHLGKALRDWKPVFQKSTEEKIYESR